MMKICNVAVIGQGRSGRDIHGAYFRSAENKLFHVSAVVDAQEDRRRRAKEEYGCDVYADYKELFSRKDIDLVVNSTFSKDHYPVAMDLMRHGFSVLCEKPFSAHVSECDDMIAEAEKNHVKLAVFQQSHYAPYMKKIREIFASGVLGRMVEVHVSFSGFCRRWDWQTSQRFYGGSLLNTGPHPMEQVLELMNLGKDMPHIFSYLDRVNTYGDAEDYVKIILTHSGSPLVDFEISPSDRYSTYLYKIQCERGTLEATMNHCKWSYFDPKTAPEQHLTLTPLCNAEGYPAYCGEKLEWHNEEADLGGSAFTSAVDDYYTMLYHYLFDGAELEIPLWKVRRIIAVMEEVHQQNPMPVFC